MENSEKRAIARKNRHNRIRKIISGTATRPRLSIFRSSKHIYVQAINDLDGITLAASSTIELRKVLRVVVEIRILLNMLVRMLRKN